jgi:hypothetical protein
MKRFQHLDAAANSIDETIMALGARRSCDMVWGEMVFAYTDKQHVTIPPCLASSLGVSHPILPSRTNSGI